MERVEKVPHKCPKCRMDFPLGKGTRWTTYRLIEQAPAAGCGACGHVEYLESRPPFPQFYMTPEGEMVSGV